GLLFKGPAPFNGVLQIPLIAKVPGLTKPAVSNSLISSIDLPKTILNLLHINERKHPPDMQGYNMTSVLERPEEKVRDCCLIEHDDEVGVIKARVRHLVTEDFKLSVYDGLSDFADLYDRKNDPHELHNLWYENDFKEKRFELVNKLLQENLKVQTKYPKRLAGT
ncbi:MAG: sulfatase/phosphatase domain-containing protein, partial [Promethearchaeota archaeon]